MNEVLPHKESTVIEPSRKHSFKAHKRHGNQETGKNLVLQNRFETQFEIQLNEIVQGDDRKL